jgi:hypothetical protein
MGLSSLSEMPFGQVLILLMGFSRFYTSIYPYILPYPAQTGSQKNSLRLNPLSLKI